MSLMSGLGRLAVQVDANVAGFVSDMGRAEREANKSMKKMERDAKRASDEMARNMRRAGTLIASSMVAAGAAVIKMSMDTARAAQDIQKESLRIGISAQAIQEIGFAAEQSDSSLEVFTRSISYLTRRSQEAQEGITTYSRAFERVGISIEELRGLNPEQLFTRFADAIAELEDPSIRIASAQQLMGRAGRELIPLLAEGSAGIEKYREQMRRTGAVMSDELIEKSKDLTDALNLLSKQKQAMQIQIASGFIPVLLETVTAINDMALSADKADGGFNALEEAGFRVGQAISVLMRAGILIAESFRTVGRMTGAWMVALVELAKIITGPLRLAFSQMTEALQAIREGDYRGAFRALTTDLFDRVVEETEKSMAVISSVAEEFAADVVADWGKAIDRVNALAEAVANARTRSASGRGLGGFVGGDGADPMAAKAAEEAAKALERARKEAERFANQTLRSLRQQFDPLRAEWEEFLETTLELDKAFELNAISAEDYIEALEGLDRRYNQNVAAIRRQQQADRESLNIVGNLVKAYEEEIKVLQMAAREAFAYDEVKRAAEEGNRLYMAGLREVNGLTEEEARTVRDAALAYWDKADAQAQAARTQQMLAMSIAGMVSNIMRGDGGIAESISQSLSQSGGAIIQEGLTDALESAFASLEMDESTAGGVMYSLGQAIGGNIGAAIGSAIGLILDAIWGQTGIFTAIGGAIGGLFDAPKDPKFQLGGSAIAFRETGGTPRGTRTSPLGDLLFRFREIEDQAQRELFNALIDFDKNLATAIGRANLDEAVAALRAFAFDSADDGLSAEAVIEERLAIVVRTLYDEFIQQLILQKDTVEDQFAALVDVISIERALFFRRDLGLFESPAAPIAPIDPGPGPAPIPGPGPGPIDPGPRQPSDPIDRVQSMRQFVAVLEGIADAADVTVPSLRRHLELLEELRRPIESLGDAFERLTRLTETLDLAIALTGTTLDMSREELIRFADLLSDVFGDDLEHLANNFSRIFQTFFSEEEMLEQQIGNFGVRAGQLLADLGIEATEEALSRAGFRDLFDDLFAQFVAAGDAEALALLSEAGAAIADLIAAEEALDRLREEVVDQIDLEADRLEFLNDIRRQTLAIVAPMWSQFDDLNTAMAETWHRAQELELAEDQLAAVRRLHQLQLEQFVTGLRESIAFLNEELFGSAEDPFDNMARGVDSAARSMRDSIIRGLEAVNQWLDRSLLDNLSTLMPVDRLAEAGNQFRSAIAAVRAGDLSRLSDLPGLADQFRREGAGFHGTSTNAFGAIESEVRAAMESVAGITPPPELQQQIADHTRQIERSAFETAMLANDLVQQMALLSRITEQSPSEIGEEFGIPIAQLIQALTGELPDLTGDALAVYFNQLVDDVATEIEVLLDIEALEIAQLSVLEDIRDVLIRIPEWFSPITDEYETGGHVPRTGPAILHGGEYVIPRGGALVSEGLGMSELAARLAGVEDQLAEANDQRREHIRVTGEGLAAVTHAEQGTQRELALANRPGSRRK